MTRRCWIFIPLLIMVACVSSPEPQPMWTPEQREYWRTTFETPTRSPDEWQAACGKTWDFGPNDRGQTHCSIQVVVDCPPDCGVYKILVEDELLRRVW